MAESTGVALPAAVAAAWNENRLDDALAPRLAREVVLHGPRPDAPEGFAGVRDGRAAYLFDLKQLRAAFGADATLSVVSSAVDGDRLFALYRIDGAHAGLFFGLPPSGQPVSSFILDSYRLEGDEVVEIWHNPDRFTLAEKLSAPALDATRATSLPVEVLADFPPGAFPESVVVHPNGDVFVTLQFDGQIVRVADGEVSVFFQLPAAALTGGLAGTVTLNVDAAGRLIVVVLSADPEYQGVWAFDVDSGAGARIASIPWMGNHLNGSAIDPAGRIYVADSNLGVIWRVLPGEAHATVWSRDQLLARREFVGLAPGANGLRFHDGALIATNSDKATVVRIPVQGDGHAGVGEVIAEGIPGDDFAVDADGSLYITTHVHDSIVLVDAGGAVRGSVATGADGIVGPTAAILVREDDADWLYVVTDGGLLIPGAQPRPQLARVRLDPDRPAVR